MGATLSSVVVPPAYSGAEESELDAVGGDGHAMGIFSTYIQTHCNLGVPHFQTKPSGVVFFTCGCKFSKVYVYVNVPFCTNTFRCACILMPTLELVSLPTIALQSRGHIPIHKHRCPFPIGWLINRGL